MLGLESRKFKEALHSSDMLDFLRWKRENVPSRPIGELTLLRCEREEA